jgi:hypothetical protein
VTRNSRAMITTVGDQFYDQSGEEMKQARFGSTVYRLDRYRVLPISKQYYVALGVLRILRHFDQSYSHALPIILIERFVVSPRHM